MNRCRFIQYRTNGSVYTCNQDIPWPKTVCDYHWFILCPIPLVTQAEAEASKLKDLLDNDGEFFS